MDLYFAPLACSMASRIALYEAGAAANFIQVDLRKKRVLKDDSDFFAINGMGQAPTLNTRDGVITENPVVLQYIADRFPDAKLAPPATSLGRYHLQQWLNFISTELHKQVFIPVLDPHAPGGAKEFAQAKSAMAFKFLDRHLSGREFLLNDFSVADAYLVTVLNWAHVIKFDLDAYPNVRAYYARLRERPSVAKALSEETALWLEEKAREQKAA
ncbi:glutathione S-transferase C-terminal domain-containing protein [Terrarubrum flagellatum]|uniref:glutathione S-transferase C-terminal domain-containing protein n=1 Tax=Terrirubrum flagellatum TaxID=2895980 RepID=UPI0031455728